MSLKQYEPIFQENSINLLEYEFDISDVVIPFSKVFKSHKPKDIYSGDENIPFKERAQMYKIILEKEFIQR